MSGQDTPLRRAFVEATSLGPGSGCNSIFTECNAPVGAALIMPRGLTPWDRSGPGEAAGGQREIVAGLSCPAGGCGQYALLEAADLGRQATVRHVAKIGVEPAILLDRADRRGAEAQAHRA